MFHSYPDLNHPMMLPLKNNLQAQCSYLMRNPTVCAYVQYVYSRIRSSKIHEVSLCRVLSVDLWIGEDIPEEFVAEFVDCLVQLPNLRTLEIFDVRRAKTIASALEQNHAQFPGIRELWASEMLTEFIGRCPNVESVTVANGPFSDLGSHGKRLKRVEGARTDHVLQGELRTTFR